MKHYRDINGNAIDAMRVNSGLVIEPSVKGFNIVVYDEHNDKRILHSTNTQDEAVEIISNTPNVGYVEESAEYGGYEYE